MAKKGEHKKLIQFKDIDLRDLDGNPAPIKDLHKTIANLIWKNAISVGLVDVAIKINRGEAVSLNPKDSAEILSILNNPQLGVFAYVRKAVKEFLEEKCPKKT